MTIALSNLTYYRLPNKKTKFSVVILKDDGQGVVMCLYLNPSKPLTINHTILLDKGYTGIFYCPYHEWHDIGAIYDRKLRFTGYYCDICSPIKKRLDGYEMTDFFLDLWIQPDNQYFVLDSDEFTNAVNQNWLTANQRTKAKNELTKLVEKVQVRNYPPVVIKSLLKLPENMDEIITVLQKGKAS